MDGRDRGDDRHIGSCNLGKCPDLPGPAHPHLGDDDLRVRLDAGERER